MAERRMFAKTIVLSDDFLDMPLSARCLYFTLGMLADDDGFVNSPKGIMRQCGASIDDLKLLMAKKFILDFESGVIVIKHWRINNYLRNDRHQATKYVEEMSQLSIKENGAYSFGIPSSGIPRIDKDSIDKNSIDNNTPFFLPTELPKTETDNKYDYSKHNNVENYFHVVNEKYQIEAAQYGLFFLEDWMEYKDNRKPKKSNHYSTEKGIVSLINQVLKAIKTYGRDAVIEQLEKAMANNWQGLNLDMLADHKQPSPKNNTFQGQRDYNFDEFERGLFGAKH